MLNTLLEAIDEILKEKNTRIEILKWENEILERENEELKEENKKLKEEKENKDE